MTGAMACEGARSTRLLAVVVTAGGVLSSCFGDPGIQVRAINTTRSIVTVYEEPREARSDLTLKPGEEFWMILCRRPGIGPCSITIRAVDDAKAVVFCRKYAQDELTRDPRVVVDTERRC